VLRSVFAQVYGTKEVNLQHMLDVFNGYVVQRFYGEDPVIAEQNIQFTEFGDGSINNLPNELSTS
jgi:cobyric acid synthase